ncbi:hypothetical protein BG006_010037 [Podila minutissima]|uniref:N,O-diacetylmuramidase n=1 Tax=Podila minutissima TaxID=64525 RepID=A0A9P5SDP2_9FUNG|nr:hypothetical protein BG006_010037 [Podila minutissima]
MRRILAILLCASAAYATQGIDVTESQGNVDWKAVAAAGKRFAYIMATRGIDHVNSFFSQQYDGAAHRHIIRGSVHYAEPNRSTGAEQATYFLSNGGEWRNDGYTLPGAVMFENGPSGDTCWGLGPDAMVAWVADFSTTYSTRTGRLPVIYTSNDWWVQCTANTATFSEHVLWIADYYDMSDPVPGGWTFYWLWQSERDLGNGLGAGDIWNSEYNDLVAFAKGPSPVPLDSSGKSE